MTNTTTYTEQQIDDWGMIFGASAGMWSWWHRIEHLDGGDWDKPSNVELAIENPDNEKQIISGVYTPEDIFAALDKATEMCPWHFVRHPEYGDLDLDASSADLVLQVAVLGEAIYG